MKGRKGEGAYFYEGGTGEKRGEGKEREKGEGEGKEMKGRAHHSTTDSFRRIRTLQSCMLDRPFAWCHLTTSV